LPTSGLRLAWLADHLKDLSGSGIIYTLTVGVAQQVADFLSSRGYNVIAYSSQTEDLERRAAEADLIGNRVKALVATSALGMGFDKADLGFVVHLGAPPSPVAYYQQIGRAGRSIEQAQVLLLPSDQDLAIWRYFASLSFPPENQVRQVLKALSVVDRPLSTGILEHVVELSRGRLEHMLKVLDVDGAVRRVDGGWVSTGNPWRHDTERYERVSAARTAEQDAMLEYISGGTCRLEYLRKCLDDALATACGRCDNCTGLKIPDDVSEEAVRALQAFVNRIGVRVAPRTQWPGGLPLLRIPLSGRIPTDELAREGRVIARLTDLGGGEELRPLFDLTGPCHRVPKRVVDLACRVFDDWTGEVPLAIDGVVAMESCGRMELVDSFAQGVADRTGLPIIGRLSAAEMPENSKANSARRVAALYHHLLVPDELAGVFRQSEIRVLLVDDLIDSGWTMTLAARALRRAGASAVFPFAIASAGRRS